MRVLATRAAGLFLGCAVFSANAGYAQSTFFPSGSAVGVTVQAISTADGWAEVPAVALHMTSIRASGFAVDVTVGTLPTALAAGVLLLAPDIAVARVVPADGGAFMVKAGPSAVILGGDEGPMGVLGFHVGAVALVRLGPSFGLRAEVVPRFYAIEGDLVSFTTLGIGFTSLPASK